HGNVGAESFFPLLKQEQIRRKTYKARKATRHAIVGDIEIFHNPKPQQSFIKLLSSMSYEKHHFEKRASSEIKPSESC
ncbi:IS3 family transposase, partial [Collimonas pratensis]|uniref:IS3 family transposase n=1 Tax=Collimonas pratensis TaxID=279113 RepID=UPI00143D9113